MKEMNNLFIIESPEGKRIAYAPLSDFAFLTEAHDITSLLKEELDRIPTAECNIFRTSHESGSLTNLMVLPNNMCNFHCSYCFSSQGRSRDELTIDKLEAGIRYFFSAKRLCGRKATLSILGGGEPLISWKITKHAIELAETVYAENHSDKLNVSIVSNCSLVDDEFISFCKEHSVFITASFDILEDIQNAQRAQYDKVLQNIVRLTDAGIKVDVTAVITRNSVFRQREMIAHIVEEIPSVSRVSFRYILSETYFKDAHERDLYYKDFIDQFFMAQEDAEKAGIELTCPYQNLMTIPVDRHCPGKFVITPMGHISTCFCVSSPKEKHFDDFIFGKIEDSGTVSLDKDKLNTILNCDKNAREECRSCPAQWHCAGGCYSDNIFMDEEEKKAYCRSMKYFLSKYLIKKYKLE